MKILSTEAFEKEWISFQNSMNKAGLGELCDDTLKSQLSTASCALSEDTGCAYAGALIHHVNLINAIALRVAKMVSASLPVDEKSLAKVCCLQHLSKIEMFEPNDNQWEVEKRGMAYKFAKLEGRLKFGERSILRATTMGVKFTPAEWEAMRSLDNTDDDKAARFFDGPLAMIVRMANELAYQIEKTKA